MNREGYGDGEGREEVCVTCRFLLFGDGDGDGEDADEGREGKKYT